MSFHAMAEIFQLFLAFIKMHGFLQTRIFSTCCIRSATSTLFSLKLKPSIIRDHKSKFGELFRGYCLLLPLKRYLPPKTHLLNSHQKSTIHTYSRKGRLLPPLPTVTPVFKQGFTIFFRGLKHVLIGSIAFLTLLFIVSRGVHLYIEHFYYSTPSSIPSKARDFLRAAYIFEEWYPNLENAQKILYDAFIIIQKEKELPPTDPIVLDILLRIANNAMRLGNLREANLDYKRIFDVLIYQDDEVNRKKAIDVAKKAAKISVKVKDFRLAEDYLIWTIETLNKELHTNKNLSYSGNNIESQVFKRTTSQDSFINLQSKMSMDLIQCTVMLAGVYATQKQFDKALPLYLGSLKMLVERKATEKDPEKKDLSKELTDSDSFHHCGDAIIMGHLGEIFYAMGKVEEAMGWFQKGFLIAKRGSGIRNCDECAGVILNNLGLINEKKGLLEDAKAFYSQALSFAEIADDVEGREEFSTNLHRIQIHDEENKSSE
ncbi:hypothetical protein G9A89_016313 [Geosiphon pyriformis]|nr:hypothetical protein G9A89_016313 [Geosiphon pyriformis]